MKHYTETIPFELAAKLYLAGMKEYDGDYYYAVTDIEISYDNYLGVGKVAKGDTFFVISGENYHGQYIPAYTYADVFDWLVERGQSIEVFLDGYYTKDSGELELHSWGYRLWHFYRHLNESGEDNPCWDDRLFEEGEIGSWKDAANSAIEKAIELLN